MRWYCTTVDRRTARLGLKLCWKLEAIGSTAKANYRDVTVHLIVCVYTCMYRSGRARRKISLKNSRNYKFCNRFYKIAECDKLACGNVIVQFSVRLIITGE